MLGQECTLDTRDWRGHVCKACRQLLRHRHSAARHTAALRFTLPSSWHHACAGLLVSPTSWFPASATRRGMLQETGWGQASSGSGGSSTEPAGAEAGEPSEQPGRPGTRLAAGDSHRADL